MLSRKLLTEFKTRSFKSCDRASSGSRRSSSRGTPSCSLTSQPIGTKLKLNKMMRLRSQRPQVSTTFNKIRSNLSSKSLSLFTSCKSIARCPQNSAQKGIESAGKAGLAPLQVSKNRPLSTKDGAVTLPTSKSWH